MGPNGLLYGCAVYSTDFALRMFEGQFRRHDDFRRVYQPSINAQILIALVICSKSAHADMLSSAQDQQRAKWQKKIINVDDNIRSFGISEFDDEGENCAQESKF